MRIVYLANTRLPTEKARGVQIMKSCEAFARAGVSVELVVPRHKNPITGDPFSYYGVERVFALTKVSVLDRLGGAVAFFSDRWAFYVRSFLFAVTAVLPRIFERKKALFYSRDYPILFLLGLFGFDFVAEMHDLRPSKARHLIQFAFSRARKIVVNSVGTKNEVLKYRVALEKIVVTPNGVDIDFFDIKESSLQARIMLGMPTDKKIVAYVGRLESIGLEKGVGDLLGAYNAIRKQRIDVVLYVVGGPDHFVQKYRNGSLLEDVVFTGQVDYRQIPLYLRAIDVVVIPSPPVQQYLTASPIKLFEFLAAGKTIIASNLPSLREVLNDQNAVFFKPEDRGDLAEKINMILDDPATREALSVQARKDVEAHSWDVRARRILSHIA